MICFHCGEKIAVGDKRQMVGIDIPYINLFFHRYPCWSEVQVTELNQYLALNKEKIYNYVEQARKKGKK